MVDAQSGAWRHVTSRWEVPLLPPSTGLAAGDCIICSVDAADNVSARVASPRYQQCSRRPLPRHVTAGRRSSTSPINHAAAPRTTH
jgi:hypothetical protein